jgi:type IV pilus assembly protein PilY1
MFPTLLSTVRAMLRGVRAMAGDLRTRFVAIGLAAVAFIGLAISADAPPVIPAIPLAAEPLYARGARAKPTLTLALSVEFPTVGAQYVASPGANEDATYAATTEYIGYFDAESCYTYNNHTDATLRRFDRSGPATGRTCGGAGFSGNFMNWALSSAIDILRYGLTGGDRVVDTAALTARISSRSNEEEPVAVRMARLPKMRRCWPVVARIPARVSLASICRKWPRFCFCG